MSLCSSSDASVLSPLSTDHISSSSFIALLVTRDPTFSFLFRILFVEYIFLTFENLIIWKNKKLFYKYFTILRKGDRRGVFEALASLNPLGSGAPTYPSSYPKAKFLARYPFLLFHFCSELVAFRREWQVSVPIIDARQTRL